jgi:hypothetical protein
LAVENVRPRRPVPPRDLGAHRHRLSSPCHGPVDAIHEPERKQQRRPQGAGKTASKVAHGVLAHEYQDPPAAQPGQGHHHQPDRVGGRDPDRIDPRKRLPERRHGRGHRPQDLADVAQAVVVRQRCQLDSFRKLEGCACRVVGPPSDQDKSAEAIADRRREGRKAEQLVAGPHPFGTAAALATERGVNEEPELHSRGRIPVHRQSVGGEDEVLKLQSGPSR